MSTKLSQYMPAKDAEALAQGIEVAIEAEIKHMHGKLLAIAEHAKVQSSLLCMTGDKEEAARITAELITDKIGCEALNIAAVMAVANAVDLPLFLAHCARHFFVGRRDLQDAEDAEEAVEVPQQAAARHDSN